MSVLWAICKYIPIETALLIIIRASKWSILYNIHTCRKYMFFLKIVLPPSINVPRYIYLNKTSLLGLWSTIVQYIDDNMHQSGILTSVEVSHVYPFTGADGPLVIQRLVGVQVIQEWHVRTRKYMGRMPNYEKPYWPNVLSSQEQSLWTLQIHLKCTFLCESCECECFVIVVILCALSPCLNV